MSSPHMTDCSRSNSGPAIGYLLFNVGSEATTPQCDVPTRRPFRPFSRPLGFGDLVRCAQFPPIAMAAHREKNAIPTTYPVEADYVGGRGYVSDQVEFVGDLGRGEAGRDVELAVDRRQVR